MRGPLVRAARGSITRLAATTCAVATCAALASCSQAQGTRAAIEVNHPTALADQPVHITVTGLAPGQAITVRSAATDQAGRVWHAQATFTASGRGVVDLDRAEARSGTYSGADGMGLFWSMVPPHGNPNQDAFHPSRPDLRPSFRVMLTVTSHGRELASRTVIREWAAAGVTHRMLDARTDKVAGELFLPPQGSPRRPAVLVFGGSEGGLDTRYQAALLASHGYPALALAYFAYPGLPPALHNIPLEYFAAAARLLAAQPAADPRRVVVMGTSRGSEAALLLGGDYPDLVHGVIVYSPNATVWPGFPGTGAAWTKGGKPVPLGVIGVDHISGPVLAIAGADDRLLPAWTSAAWARQIVRELGTARNPFPHQALVFPGAGHAVGSYPYLPTGTMAIQPQTGNIDTFGGTRAGDEAARVAGWSRVLALLASLTR